MKYFLSFFLLMFSFLSIADDQVLEICSNKVSVCAEIISVKPLTSKEEGRFKLTLKGDFVELKKVDLWMQMGNHGHGSSPLKVSQTAPQVFDVTEAYFVMRGMWQIRVKFSQNNFEETLILNVKIN